MIGIADAGARPMPKSRRAFVLNASERTIKLLCVQHVLCKPKASECTILINRPCFPCFFLCISKSFQIPSEHNIYRPCFHFFSLQFQIVSNTVRIHYLPSLFSFYSLHFQIVLNTVTMHALETLFSSISLQFNILPNTVQILSECMKI